MPLTWAYVCTYTLSMNSPEESIIQCLEILDSSFLKALSEPARIEILKTVVRERHCDVSSVAAQVPQDRSVVARHLQILARAKVLRATTEGRHTYYEIDGDGVTGQLRTVVNLLEEMAPLCCPT